VPAKVGIDGYVNTGVHATGVLEAVMFPCFSKFILGVSQTVRTQTAPDQQTHTFLSFTLTVLRLMLVPVAPFSELPLPSRHSVGLTAHRRDDVA
jgi:hypothetical protein